MQLGGGGGKCSSELRDPGPLVFPHRNDDLCGFELLTAGADDVTPAPLEEPLDADAATHRQSKACGIRLEIARHLVLGRKVVARRGKWHSVESVEPSGREQPQRVPAASPRIADSLIGIQDDEPNATGPCEVIADRKPGLTATDHDYIELLAPGRFGTRPVPREMHCRCPFLDQFRSVTAAHRILPC